MRSHNAPLPIIVMPIDGEAISSWWHRIAHANALSLRELQELIRNTNGPSLRLPPTELSPAYLDHLAYLSGVQREEIEQRFVYSTHRLQAYGRVRYMVDPLTTRFCPLCWSADRIPHIRRGWASSFGIVCLEHRCFLLAGCPRHATSTEERVRTMDHRTPLHQCPECWADLRKAMIVRPDDADFFMQWQRFWDSEEAPLPAYFLWRARPTLSAASRVEQREFARFVWSYFVIPGDFTGASNDTRIHYRATRFVYALAAAMQRLEDNLEKAFAQLSAPHKQFVLSSARKNRTFEINTHIQSLCLQCLAYS